MIDQAQVLMTTAQAEMKTHLENQASFCDALSSESLSQGTLDSIATMKQSAQAVQVALQAWFDYRNLGEL